MRKSMPVQGTSTHPNAADSIDAPSLQPYAQPSVLRSQDAGEIRREKKRIRMKGKRMRKETDEEIDNLILDHLGVWPIAMPRLIELCFNFIKYIEFN